MSKLPKKHQFIDLSDYGRLPARQIAKALKHTSVTPINVTSSFILSGILAVICMLNNFAIAAAFFLILKSTLDAADGELSRLKKMPSYVGRYYDSIADFILNFVFLLTFWYITDGSLLLMFLAFFSIQLQGTLYNYYYVILRNNVNGDMTSRIFEDEAPKAMEGEEQDKVDAYFKVFNLLYSFFDKTIHRLDKKAISSKPFPNWFMTITSTLGLGFQLLVMALALVFHLEIYLFPFFITYSLLLVLLIVIRRVFL